MKRLLQFLAPLVTLMFLSPPPVAAESKPLVQGAIAGIEIVPQSWGGAAVFAGVFEGQVGNRRNAFGVFLVAVNHDPLPDAGEMADITGGTWRLSAGGKKIQGVVKGGALLNNGDDTYSVLVVLELTQGGQGEIYFAGTLDHRPLFAYPPYVPTLVGKILQQAP